MKSLPCKSCLFSLILALFIVRPGVAQTRNEGLRHVKIILTSGTVLKGNIGKSISEDYITLIPDWDTVNAFNLPFDYIKSMEFGRYREVSGNKDPKPLIKPVLSEPGFYHVFTFGLAMGENKTNLMLSSENGYRINDHFAGGLGVNYDRYTNISSLPVYLNFRGYLRNKRVSPFYFLGGGYGFGWNNGKEYMGYQVNNVKGGIYGQTGLGYQIQYSQSAISFNLGYKIQKTTLDYEYRNYYQPWSSFAPQLPSDNNMIVHEKRLVRRMFVSFSVVF